MSRGKYVLVTALLLLVAAAAGAGSYFWPVWRAARAVQEKMGSAGWSYELEVELDEQRQPQERRQMFEVLAKLTGMETEDMYRLTIKGDAQEGKSHMTIYPKGRAEPLAEFYLSDDIGVINETMLYDAIRSHLVGEYGILDYLMPRQRETLYMTLEQVEQLLGADLDDIRGFALPSVEREITAGEYFFLLAAMDRQEGGRQFAVETEQGGLCFEVGTEGAEPHVAMRFWAVNPAEGLAKAEELLTRVGVQLPMVDLSTVKSLSATLEPGEGGAIEMPTRFVNQDVIDLIAKIRSWLEENFGEKLSDNDNIL